MRLPGLPSFGGGGGGGLPAPSDIVGGWIRSLLATGKRWMWKIVTFVGALYILKWSEDHGVFGSILAVTRDSGDDILQHLLGFLQDFRFQDVIGFVADFFRFLKELLGG